MQAPVPQPLSKFQRYLLALLVFLSAIASLATPFVFPPDQNRFPEFGENDFIEYWTAGRIAWDGLDPFDPELVFQIEKNLGWKEPHPLMMWNPPWTVVLLSPIIAVDFDTSARSFLGLNAGLALLSSAFVAIALGFDGALLVAAICLSVFSFPMYLLLLKGQITLLPFTGIALLLFAIRQRLPWLAGLALVLVTIKPHLGFLLLIPLAFWIVKTLRFRFLWTAIGGGSVLLLLTWLMTPESFSFWWLRSQHRSSPLLIDVTQWRTTTLSFIFRNIVHHYTGRFLIWPMWAIPAIGALLVTGVCAYLLRTGSAAQYFTKTYPWNLIAALLLPLSLALAPFGWIFDAVTCSVSALFVMRLIFSGVLPRLAAVALGASLAALQLGTLWYGLQKDPTLEYYWFYAPGFFLLSYIGWVSSRKKDPPEAVSSAEIPVLPPDPLGLKPAWIYLAPLLAVAGLLRFPGIMRLPPYFDESGNILIALSEMTSRILDPVRQARPFLAYQFGLTKFIPADPMLVSRALTSITALLSLTLLFFIVRRAIGTTAAILAGALWATNPCLVFHERMALQDPFISMFLLAALGSFVLSRKYPDILNASFRDSWKNWLAAAVFFGLAVATKVTAITTLPFLGTVLLLFTRSSGARVRADFDLFNRFCFFTAIAVLSNLLIAGTFIDYGLDHMALGHLAHANPAQPSSRIAQALEHIGMQYDLISTYTGKPAVWIYFSLLIIGMLFPATRVFSLLCVGIVLLNTQMYRGRWYTRYLHPDFILHTLLITLVVTEVARRYWSTNADLRRRTIAAFIASAVFAGLFMPNLARYLRDPVHAPVPQHDFYTNGYFSGLGVRELRKTVDEEIGRFDQLVLFSCQFWCSGMYDLLLHSYSDERLFVIPFELKHPNRVLGMVKAIERFRSKLSGRTAFAILFEPPRYPILESLSASGLKTTLLLDLLRDEKSQPPVKFHLLRIDEADRSSVLDATQAQKRPYTDNWLGPKAELKLAELPKAGLAFRFPKQLPKETDIAIRLNGEPLVESRLEKLENPLRLSFPESATANRTNTLSLRCSDWIVPQLSSGARDNRALCAGLSESLRLQPEQAASDEQAAEDTKENSSDKVPSGPLF